MFWGAQQTAKITTTIIIISTTCEVKRRSKALIAWKRAFWLIAAIYRITHRDVCFFSPTKPIKNFIKLSQRSKLRREDARKSWKNISERDALNVIEAPRNV